MLRELANLIAEASYVAGVCESNALNGEQIEAIRNAIEEAAQAVGRHDEEKRKTDLAINVLFQSIHLEDQAERIDYANRAERLLGFSQLEAVK